MLIGAEAVAVWLVVEPCDMRKSIDGLAQAVVDSLHRRPISGEVFAFRNQARDKVKLLWWDKNGFWVAYKRLEAGKFRWATAGGRIELSELMLLLEGVDLCVPRLRRVEVQQVN